jgi:hypothetical protein
MSVSDEQNEKLRLTQELQTLIELHFNDLMRAANARAQQKLTAARTQAHVNAGNAALTILEGNEPQVQSLIQSLEKTQKKIEKDLEDMRETIAVIDLIVTAVQLGTRLVALGL